MRAFKIVFPLLLLTASGMALAAEGEEGAEAPSFEALDTDADGIVTRDEAMADPGLEENFDQLDANADGVLTPEEIGVGGPEGEGEAEGEESGY